MNLDARQPITRIAVMAFVTFVVGSIYCRPAGADQCKPNRSTCKTNSQCCSGVCAAGLCAAPTSSTTSTSTSTTTTSTTPPTVCGDGILGAGEQCEDGNEDPGDGCFECHIEHCGNGVIDSGEECDGSGDCASDCVLIACGNGRLDPGEECDDGNDSDDDFCSATCTYEPCGAGTTLVDNECQPDYPSICGTGTQLVNGQCVPEATCPPPSCGDGNLDVGEACDDGNLITESECPYGTQVCEGCKSDCSMVVSLTGPFCGDGFATCPEACDDGNTFACGTCSANCSQVHLAHATGLILAVDGASLADGETFTIDDGAGMVVTFEFDVGDGVAPEDTPINLADTLSASAVADSIRNAINDSALQIDATGVSNLVSLTNQRQSSLGNVPITKKVADDDFTVAGMAGGAGGDCPTGVGCTADGDCASGSCSSETSTCEAAPD